MSHTVVVPARDYVVPVDRSRDYTTTYGTGLLLINATDYLLLNASGDRLILQGTSTIQAPVVVVPYRDYIIPVPERDTNG